MHDLLVREVPALDCFVELIFIENLVSPNGQGTRT